MACRTTRSVAIAAGLLLLQTAAAAQPELTLEQAQSRTGPDHAIAHGGLRVTVRGTVATPAVWTAGSYLLGIRDGAGFGLALLGPSAAAFERLAPGDRISAAGTIAQHAGMAVLSDFEIDKTSSGPPPGPVQTPLDQIPQFRSLGLPVITEGFVLEIRNDDGGDYLVLGPGHSAVRFFVPKFRGDVIMDSLSAFRPGDRVRVRGLAIQHCVLPPYDRSFQIVAYERNPIELIEAYGGPARYALPALALFGILAGAGWYFRERKLGKRRNALQSLNALGEELLSAGSASEIQDKLAEMAPRILGATGIRLYEFNRKTRMLDRRVSAAFPDPFSINLEAPSGPLATGAALAFRSRTIVNVPDTRRSPILKARENPDVPRSVMFVPMFAQDEVFGVLQVDHAAGIRYFGHDEQAGAQHLANQAAASLKLLEQQAVREQLFRSEKLAATAQLISGIAAELRAPLENLLATSRRLLNSRQDAGQEDELRLVAAEAQRASEIVARLVSFGREDNAAPRSVEVNDMLRSLIRFREREWKAQNLRPQQKLWNESLHAMAAQGQLEQVFLSILVHAEQCVLECPDKTVSVSSMRMGNRAVVEFRFGCAEGARDPFIPQSATEPGGLGLAVIRGILRNHGGEARFSQSGRMCCIEVELPAVEAAAPAEAPGGRPRRTRTLTTLLLDPDPPRQRRILKELTRRDHRVVPVARVEEALDLAGRSRFDLVVCSAHAAGLNWPEFAERTQSQIGAYVTLGLAPHAPAAGGRSFVLEDGADDAEFDRVLAQAENVVEGPVGSEVNA